VDALNGESAFHAVALDQFLAEVLVVVEEQPDLNREVGIVSQLDRGLRRRAATERDQGSRGTESNEHVAHFCPRKLD
jgi:hypothetical protein